MMALVRRGGPPHTLVTCCALWGFDHIIHLGQERRLGLTVCNVWDYGTRTWSDPGHDVKPVIFLSQQNLALHCYICISLNALSKIKKKKKKYENNLSKVYFVCTIQCCRTMWQLVFSTCVHLKISFISEIFLGCFCTFWQQYQWSQLTEVYISKPCVILIALWNMEKMHNILD